MEMWNDFITREDLETETGEIDQDKVRVLSINLYLTYLKDCVDLGGYEDPAIAAERIEDIMVEEFSCYTHALEGRYPEPDEIAKHLRKRENIEARRNWIYIMTHANKDNIADIVKRIREEGIPEGITLKNEERIRQQMEKTVQERTWTFREL